MVDRRGPTDGYDVGAKRQYRRDVWALLARECPVPRAEAQCFLLPSIEGDEIDVALGKGFREQNLHVCDDSPYVVAMLKRRFRRINTYGINAWRALTERAPWGGLDLINLDLCGTAWRAVRTVSAAATCLRENPSGGILSVTYTRGRDRAATRLKDLLGHDTDGWREVTLDAAVSAGSNIRCEPIAHRRYLTARVPMAWTAYRIEGRPPGETLDSWSQDRVEATQFLLGVVERGCTLA